MKVYALLCIKNVRYYYIKNGMGKSIKSKGLLIDSLIKMRAHGEARLT
ncbi:protein of unknown function [Mesotoga infera]|uniref:Uncharacterized protein n=1 Tax=Mesotoga infera TaxID=1236046 RepID=A0A7Z7LDA5_9BACT|nr:protein of unknown function [Mesotoga infera]